VLRVAALPSNRVATPASAPQVGILVGRAFRRSLGVPTTARARTHRCPRHRDAIGKAPYIAMSAVRRPAVIPTIRQTTLVFSPKALILIALAGSAPGERQTSSWAASQMLLPSQAPHSPRWAHDRARIGLRRVLGGGDRHGSCSKRPALSRRSQRARSSVPLRSGFGSSRRASRSAFTR
jgi:hypothetical protein